MVHRNSLRLYTRVKLTWKYIGFHYSETKTHLAPNVFKLLQCYTRACPTHCTYLDFCRCPLCQGPSLHPSPAVYISTCGQSLPNESRQPISDHAEPNAHTITANIKRQEERWEFALSVESARDNAEATLQKHKCEWNRGKLTWQGFAITFLLSKTNINKWANTQLTCLTPQEHLIYRTIKMIKTLAFLIGSRGTLGIT